MAIKALIWMVRIFDPPIYCYHEIVHNRWVVESFEKMGVVFVDDISEVPTGMPVMLSAHGSAPQVVAAAHDQSEMVVDSICPLVAKIHHEVKMMSKNGYQILYIGHEGHDEAVGTMAISPQTVTLVTPEEGLGDFEPEDPERVALLAQTTLGVYEWGAIHDEAADRFPDLWTPRRSDLCYATTNRQEVVQKMAEYCDVILVVGSDNSSNTQALVRVATELGAVARRINQAADIRPEWLEKAGTVGLTAGASAPEHLVEEVIEALAPRRGVELAHVTDEDEYFPLPVQLRGLIPLLGQLVEAALTVPASDWNRWKKDERLWSAFAELTKIVA